MGIVFITLVQVLLSSILINNNQLKCVAGDILSNYDFNKLKNAVTDAFADDANMDHVMMARMVSFQERIRKERSSSTFDQLPLQESEFDEDDEVLFEPTSDYYSFDGINLDFGNIDQLALNKIVQTSVYHRDSTITDLDTIGLDNGQFVGFATRNMITTWFYPSSEKNDFKVANFGLEGIRRLEPILMNQPVQSNNSHERQMLVIIALAVTDDHQTISWYSWNDHDNTLYRNGSLELAEGGMGMDIRIFHIPVTDIHMLASMQTTKIQMYIVSLNKNGRFYVKSCGNIPIVRAKDFESFSINGHLYVAVTNGRTTTVWKYRAHEEDFVLHQKLGSTDATDIQYFRIGYEHFLGVVDVGFAAIYQWKGAILVRIQTLHLPNEPLKWHSIVDEDEALLMLILKDQLLFFAWNKLLHQFVSCGHWHDGELNFQVDVRAISYSGHSNGYHALLVATHRTLIKLDVHLKHQRTVPETKTDLFYDEAYTIRKELDRQEKFLNEASNLLKSIKAKLMEPSDVPRITSSASHPKLCNDLNSKLDNVEQSLRSTKTLMTSLLQQDLTDKVYLKGKRTFRSVKVLETAEVRGNLKTDSLNGLNMSYFFKDSIMSKATSYVTGLKTFTGKVVIRDSVEVTQNLNAQNPDDLIHLNKPQTIYGMKFLAPVTVEKNIKVSGLVNGIDLSEDAILLNSNKLQTITDKIFLDEVTVEDEVLIAGNINGIKLSKLAADTVTSSGIQQITGNKLFTQMTVKGDVTANRVNGLDLKILDSRTVRVDRPTIVKAPKTFVETVSISNTGELRTETVNGLRFPEDFVHVSEKRVVLSGLKNFAKSVTVNGDFMTNGKLDGIDLKDVMRTTGDQELCGSKTFVGPVQVTHFQREMGDISTKPFIETVIVHGNLHVAHSINDVPLNDIVLKNETNVVLHGPVTFLNPQNLNMSTIHIDGYINGMDLKKDFLHPYGNQIITGSKIFLKPVTVKGDLEIGHKLDGVNLRKLTENVVSLSSSTNTQSVFGRKSFIDGFSVDDTLVLPSLASKNLFPRNLNLKSLIVNGNLMVDGYVNDVNFQELQTKRMTLKTDQEILAPVRIRGKVHINNIHILGKLNGHNVSVLWNDILVKNETKNTQLFTGRKRFTGRVHAQQLFTKHGLNGLSIKDIKDRTVPIVNGKILSGSQYSFDGGVVVDGPLDIRGTIDGIELAKTVMDSVRKHSHAYPVIGTKVFEELHVEGSVWVDGAVNDLFLERDVLTATTPQNITGQYNLRKDARFTDSVKMSSFKAQTLHVHGDLAVHSLTTGGNVNGVNLKHLQQDAVLKNQHLQNIPAEKTFHGVVRFHEDVSVKHDINGFDYVEHFKHIVVSDSSPQVVTGKKQFISDVDAKVVIQCKGPVSLTGSLNGVDADEALKRFEQPHIIDNHVTIHGSLKIIGDVKTHNTLNGLNISKDVMIDPGQAVSGTKTIKTLIVNGNINANSVNGYNLNVLRHDTLTTDGNERVTGRKIVKGTITIHSSNIPSRSLDKDLEPSVQSKKQKLHFHGNVTFLNGVTKTQDSLQKLSNKSQSCNSVNSCKTLAAINRATVQKASSFLSMNFVQTVTVSDIAATELIKTFSELLFVIGFSSCDKRMEINVWNSEQKKFFLRGKLNVVSVFKMKTVYGIDDEPLLCILHRNCQTGQNITSMYSVRHEQLELKIASRTLENVVDFDVVFLNTNKDSLLMATLQESSKIVLEKFVGSAKKLLSVTNLPSNGDRIRWLSISHDRPLLMINAKKSDETLVYETSPNNGLLRHLYTLEAYGFSSWTVGDNVAFLVATQRPMKSRDIYTTAVYKMERNSSGLFIVEINNLETETRASPTTVETTFDTTQRLCAINYGHKINVYTKGSSGNYFHRSSMLLEETERAIPVFTNGHLLLVTNTYRGWNAFLSDLHYNRETEFNCFDG